MIRIKLKHAERQSVVEFLWSREEITNYNLWEQADGIVIYISTPGLTDRTLTLLSLRYNIESIE